MNQVSLKYKIKKNPLTRRVFLFDKEDVERVTLSIAPEASLPVITKCVFDNFIFCNPNIQDSKSMANKTTPSTLLTLPGDLGFIFPDKLPFNTAPRQGVKRIAGSFLYTLRIMAEPVIRQHWREKLARGESVLFSGIRAGTDKSIELNAKASSSKKHPNHLIISFYPVAS